MGYIFDDWKDLLDEFQKCVDKDLAEACSIMTAIALSSLLRRL